MKIYVLTDLEGPAMVSRFDQTREDGPRKQIAMKPTVFISGDDKAVIEAKQLVPNIYSVATKQGLGQELALHLSPQKSRESIRETAAEACSNICQIVPLKVDPPYEQEIRVLEGQSIEGYLRGGAAKVDDRTVVKSAETICVRIVYRRTLNQPL